MREGISRCVEPHSKGCAVGGNDLAKGVGHARHVHIKARDSEVRDVEEREGSIEIGEQNCSFISTEGKVMHILCCYNDLVCRSCNRVCSRVEIDGAGPKAALGDG